MAPNRDEGFLDLEEWEDREREETAGALVVCACFCLMAAVVFAVIAIVMAMTR